MSLIPEKLSFPEAIDSSMRAAFVACPHKFFYEHIWQIAPASPNRHLHAGASFARGLEVARKVFFEGRGSKEDAEIEGFKAFILAYGEFEVADGETKGFADMLGALDYYFEQYPIDTDPIRPVITPLGAAVEFTFALEIPNTRHPETGNPLLYFGRFDQLCSFNDTLFVEDDKTASQLGASWANQWELRSQLTGYCWAARQYGYSVQGAIVRGISILKTGYGNAQEITYRPQWQIDRWLHQLQRDVGRMLDCWREQYWDYTLDGACSHYGGCAYLSLCKSANPENWLVPDYQRREWNPMVKL